jgi:spore coat polysaccharide biosynthesis protein SpsF
MPRSVPHLVLGTAQLGTEYGAANRSGMPDEATAATILKTAVQFGITEIDTARAYGHAERRIGLALKGDTSVEVITKLAPIGEFDNASSAISAAAASISESCRAFRPRTVQTLLLHRASNRLDWDGAIWRFLLRERELGVIRKLGVSVQTPLEALSAISDPDVTHIQLPYNLLDYRWTEVIDAIRLRENLSVHVRSVFLQGLLTGQQHARWPSVAGVDRDPILAQLHAIAERLGRLDLADLCVAYVRGQDWIDGIVIGMESLEQLERNLALFKMKPLPPGECDLVRATIPKVPDAFLDPAKWPIENAKHQQDDQR